MWLTSSLCGPCRPALVPSVFVLILQLFVAVLDVALSNTDDTFAPAEVDLLRLPGLSTDCSGLSFLE